MRRRDVHVDGYHLRFGPFWWLIYQWLRGCWRWHMTGMDEICLIRREKEKP
jgi:hypothetical protein